MLDNITTVNILRHNVNIQPSQKMDYIIDHMIKRHNNSSNRIIKLQPPAYFTSHLIAELAHIKVSYIKAQRNKDDVGYSIILVPSNKKQETNNNVNQLAV